MNPIKFNCVLLYGTVILLSIIQSRARIIKDNPFMFVLFLVITPLIIMGKIKGPILWTDLTGFLIWGWTLMLAYGFPKRIIPRINEGYIYAYTLFHWYLLINTTMEKGFTFFLILVIIISLFPTYLIFKASIENKKLTYKNKLLLYYWFLFTISFTYIDQVALNIIKPIVTLPQINILNGIIILISAIQLYFIATCLSLLFVGIPAFHLDRTWRTFKEGWTEAMIEWRQIVNYELANFIEYQINIVQLFYITLASGILFYLDSTLNFRFYLILIYTVLIPLIFFYFKLTPDENFEEIINEKGSS